MATKIQSLPWAVVIKMVKADLMESYKTHYVQVLTIGLCDSDEFDDDDFEQSILVTAEIHSGEECFAKDCGTHTWRMTWDEEDCDFCLLVRLDQDEDDDEHLPPHIVERCKYVAMTMDSTDMSHCNVDPDKKLEVPVERIRWNYPFEVEKGDYNVYPIETATTWGELLTRIVEVFQREYAAHEKDMAHAIGDYIIEPLEIHPNGLATVCFGS